MICSASPRMSKIISRQLWIEEVYGVNTKLGKFLTTKNCYSPSPMIFQPRKNHKSKEKASWVEPKATILKSRNWVQAFTKFMDMWEGDNLTQHINISSWTTNTFHSLLFNRVTRKFDATHQCKTVSQLRHHPQKALTSVFDSVLSQH